MVRDLNGILSFIEGTKDFFIQNGVLGLFILAFTEASFFPIPPDIILLPLSIIAPGKALYYAAVTSVASSLGGIFGYFIGARAGRPILEKFIKEKNMDKIEDMFSKYGGWAVGVAGFTPIPYKVFTIASGVFQMNLSTFIIATILSRSARFFLEGVIVMALGDRALAYINKFLGPGSFIIVGIAIMLYLLIKKSGISLKLKPGQNSLYFHLKGRLKNYISIYGEFSIYLIAGFSIASTLGIMFFKLATEVFEKELEGFDYVIMNFVKNIQFSFFPSLFNGINAMQRPYIFFILLIISLLFTKLLLEKWRYPLITFMTFIGSFTLQSSFKTLYRRPRISAELQSLDFLAYSFPSGFISIMTALSGYIVYLILRKFKKQHSLMVFLWVLFLAMISMSRIYAGISYPSDVLAGILLGGVWLVICIVATKVLECYDGL